jgi:hypothetical protein
MAFQVSPGVVVKEKDLTTIVPAVSTTVAGFAGRFQWGPAAQRITIDSENNLRSLFGDPDDNNYEYFFTAANYLGYGNNLQVVRVIDNAVAKNAASTTGTLVKNDEHYDSVTAESGDKWIAKYPGSRGNSLKVVWHDGGDGTTSENVVTISSELGLSAANADTVAQFGSTAPSSGNTFAQSDATFVGTVADVASALNFGVNTSSGTLATGITIYEISSVGGTTYGVVAVGANVSGFSADTDTDATNYKSWQYANQFPTNMPFTTSWLKDLTGRDDCNDGVNIAVIDEDGDFSGTKGTVLETFDGLSKASNAKKFNGESNYYKNVINDASKYIWWGEHPTQATGGAANVNVSSAGSAWGTAATVSGITFAVLTTGVGNTSGYASSLVGGTGENTGNPTGKGGTADEGYGLFEDSETVDVSLLLGGPADATLAGQLVDLCDTRKDCVVFLSPEKSDVISSGTPLRESTCETNVLDFRNTQLNKNSSYAFLDSGWKYMYDRYNDVFRWVPLNGDIAGLAVRSDEETETWFSPAGFNRGQIRGVTKLSWNPRKANRDNLYKDQVNPIVSFPGEGTILFGDKTLASKPSSFDRLNVRRLFIVLEKAISTAAKYQLFEQNDAFTRSNFKSIIEPFLRDVQARRGITEFKVVCDESNNPGSVIDRNEFVADIYIKPTRSINFITLNFIATRSGVDFTEVGA